MRGQQLLEKMALIREDYVEAAEKYTHVKKPSTTKRWLSAAACLVLLISAGLGTYAYAEEVKEYSAALDFFEEYCMSTDGLTREEIKKVYHDITTKSFTYSKTAEVILGSLSEDKVGGFEIPQENPTPEDIENLWNYKNYNGYFPYIDRVGISYSHRDEYRTNGDGVRVFDMSYVEKYDGETLVWRTPIPNIDIRAVCEVSDGVIAYGKSTIWLYSDFIAKIDEDGNLIWSQQHGNIQDYATISKVLEQPDGNYAVMSNINSKLCLTRYSSEGEVLFFKQTEYPIDGFTNAVCYRDGYLVQFTDYRAEGEPTIIKIDLDGNVTEEFTYSAENEIYHITDMIEFDGKIYLSASAVPKPDEENKHLHTETPDLLRYLFDNHIWDISSEEFTPMLRAYYTAVLLVCDDTSGTPQTFYSVEGSLGAKLELSESGNLIWNVERITTAFYSPATNSFNFGGTCHVFKYTFDPAGMLIGQIKTDEITIFRR